MNSIKKQWYWEPGNLDTCKMPGFRISTPQGSVEVKQHTADTLDALADIAHEQEEAMRELWDKTDKDPEDPNHWCVDKNAGYSSDDETAMAAFDYPSDSCETDRWR